MVRQDYNGLRRYAHIGTGNYHPGTARIYADFGLLTCDDADRPGPDRSFSTISPPATRPIAPIKKILPAPALLEEGADRRRSSARSRLHSAAVARA